ncbi:MAG: DUF4396 domain-containing protein [Chloroflexota bacterium]|nr:DUF4396 domain-containing protein [Chloroflexota bacterium]
MTSPTDQQAPAEEHTALNHSSNESDARVDPNLNPLAFSATLHCLTGCIIGEVIGLAIGTALGFSELGTIALAIGLAYLFGFALTSLPLFKAGLTFSAIVPIALATDFVSITIMEAIDNAFIAVIPGALHAGLLDWLMWTAMLGGFAIAFPFAFLANRALLRRGKGHALVHQYHA